MANFYYNKISKELKMHSENKIKYDTKKLAMVSIDKVDWDKMNFNYKIKVVNGKLQFTLKDKSIIEKKEELETELEKATDLDKTKELIKKLINL